MSGQNGSLWLVALQILDPMLNALHTLRRASPTFPFATSKRESDYAHTKKHYARFTHATPPPRVPGKIEVELCTAQASMVNAARLALTC
jgi:hypothetical protein